MASNCLLGRNPELDLPENQSKALMVGLTDSSLPSFWMTVFAFQIIPLDLASTSVSPNGTTSTTECTRGSTS